MNSAHHNCSENSIPTRNSLLIRLKDWDDQQSWQEFYETYWKLIYGFALKAGLRQDEAEEVLQETVLSVARKMNEFKYDPALGSFKGWLLQLTRWRIYDQFRKRKPEQAAHPCQDDTDRTPIVERVASPESLDFDSMWDEEWQKNIMDAAIARIKRKVNPKHYQVFDMYVIKRWPVAQITKTLGVSEYQVYKVASRVSEKLKEEAKALEAKLI